MPVWYREVSAEGQLRNESQYQLNGHTKANQVLANDE